MHWPVYLLTRFLALFFRLLPFPVLYALSDVFAWSMYRLIGYRRQVVRDNLRQAFPDLPEADMRRLIRATYRNLTDVTFETVKEFTMSNANVRRRMVVCNPQLLNAYIEKGQSVLLSGSHLCCWEWSGLTIPGCTKAPVIAAYKPLSNPYIDRFFNRRRSAGGMNMVSMEETFAAIRKSQGNASVFLLLSDQSPSSRKSAQWLPFFGLPTAFLPGIDVLSRKFNYPVLYYRIQRLRRGFYEMEFFELAPEPAALPAGEVTRRYAELLERHIREQAGDWLWSHKRWKIKPEADN